MGFGVSLLDPMDHVCTATIRVPQDTSGKTLARCRQALLDFAWRNIPADTSVSPSARHWHVDTPGSNVLRLLLRTGDRTAGLAQVRDVAERFVTDIRSEAATARATLSSSEKLLADYAAELASRLQLTESMLEQPADEEAESALVEQAGALDHWRNARDQFIALRAQLSNAEQHLAALEATGEPTHGVVPPEERRGAHAADAALQQDLRELFIHLTELKTAIREVETSAAAPMAQLDAASEKWVAATAEESRPLGNASQPAPANPDTSPGITHTVAQLHEIALQYRAAALAWFALWNAEHESLRAVDPDPLGSELLDIHERLRSGMGRFLFDSGKLLASARSLLRTMDELLGDDARHYVRQSNLNRAFELVQAAHHRFEFAAGAISARDNYRLDSAVRGASGLRRRSQARLRAIDDALNEKAMAVARARRSEDLQRSRVAVAELRERFDVAVEGLVALQENLNIHTDLTADYLRASLSTEFAGTQAALTRADLACLLQGRTTLEKQRLALASEGDLILLSCEVLTSPS